MLVHVSLEEVEKFELRVPKHKAPGEDDTIKRICLSSDIEHALLAIPKIGQIIKFALEELKLEPLIYVYCLQEKDIRYDWTNITEQNKNRLQIWSSGKISEYVPDAKGTKEHWLLDEPRDKMELTVYKITSAKCKDCVDGFGNNLILVSDLLYEAVEDAPSGGNYHNLLANLNLSTCNKKIEKLKKYGVRRLFLAVEEECSASIENEDGDEMTA